MVSELSFSYNTGKHWTGSMIDLGYSRHEFNLGNNRNCMNSVEDSSLPCFSRRYSSRRDGQRGSVASGLFIKRFLKTTSFNENDAKADGDTMPPSLVQLILQLLKEKEGVRHSLTSLLPSEMQEPLGYDFRHRKTRCRSCEPQAKSSQFGGATLSTLFFERFFRNLQGQMAERNAHLPRKRLSLSDSEICYTENATELNLEETLERDDTEEHIPEISEDTTAVKSSESVNSSEEPIKAPIFESGPAVDENKLQEKEEDQRNEEVDCSSEPSASMNPPTPTSEKLEQPLEDFPVIKVSKKKKSVRFADDEGGTLFQEKIILNTSLPPTLNLKIDDDFRDLGDDSLPGVIRPSFRKLGQKTSSLPDIKKIPPPVPGLHHSNSSNESLNLSVPISPPSLTSPTNGNANWRITFAQPACQYLAFRQRLDSKFVSLENITLGNRSENANSLFIYGKAKVKNIAFEKHVKLRVTTDRWATYKDYPAVYNVQPTSSSAVSSAYDQFMFNFSVDISQMPEPREVQFAVCFQAGVNGEGGEYWDNNDGFNYVVVEEVESPPVGTYDSFRNYPPAGAERSPMRTAVGGREQSPPTTAYTLDYRPNFNSFSSLTSYSSWQHYSSESMYY